jgi:hypothetical protein
VIYNVTVTACAADTADIAAVAAAANLRLMGFTVRESAGTPAVATLAIRHGTVATDTIIAPVSLIASDTKTAWFGPQGIPCASGIYVDRIAGNTTITLYTALDN